MLSIVKPMASSPQRKLIEAGSRAPAYRELAANGPALVAFFKVTCPVCQLTFPFLDRIHQAGTLPIYGISQNDEDDTADFTRRFGVTFPTLYDREEDGYPASNAFGISAVPTLFLIEKDGTISHVIEGWNRKEIEWLGAKAGVNPIRQDDNVPAWKSG